MKAALAIIWQAVWGLPQTLAGALVFLAHARKPHFAYHGAFVTVWDLAAGLSLGPFIFLNAPGGTMNEKLLVHEYGHTVQSLILGPLYLICIGAPSVIWFKTPAFARRRSQKGISYYAFYTERWANSLGERALGKPSMGQAIVD